MADRSRTQSLWWWRDGVVHARFHEVRTAHARQWKLAWTQNPERRICPPGRITAQENRRPRLRTSLVATGVHGWKSYGEGIRRARQRRTDRDGVSGAAA